MIIQNQQERTHDDLVPHACNILIQTLSPQLFNHPTMLTHAQSLILWSLATLPPLLSQELYLPIIRNQGIDHGRPMPFQIKLPSCLATTIP